jgi:hypothetical protein
MGASQIFVINEKTRTYNGRLYHLAAIKWDPESRGPLSHATDDLLCYINGVSLHRISGTVQGAEKEVGFVEPISPNETGIFVVWIRLPESGVVEMIEGSVNSMLPQPTPKTDEEWLAALLIHGYKVYKNKITIQKMVIDKGLTMDLIKEKIRKGEYTAWKNPDAGGDVAPNTAATGVGTERGKGVGTDGKSGSFGSGSTLWIPILAAGAIAVFVVVCVLRRKMLNQSRK